MQFSLSRRFSLLNFPSFFKNRSTIPYRSTDRSAKERKKKERNKRGGSEKWLFQGWLEKVGLVPHRFSRWNPLALRNRSVPLITIEQESFWCRPRSIIGGERTAGRQSKRFVTAAEERVRCSFGRKGGEGGWGHGWRRRYSIYQRLSRDENNSGI